jgi:hypothetical protein
MLKKLVGLLALTVVLTAPRWAGASAFDEYAEAAFGDTGATWHSTSIKYVGKYVAMTLVPDRDIGIVAADLTILPDGEIYSVTVHYGSLRGSSRPTVRIR